MIRAQTSDPAARGAGASRRRLGVGPVTDDPVDWTDPSAGSANASSRDARDRGRTAPASSAWSAWLAVLTAWPWSRASPARRRPSPAASLVRCSTRRRVRGVGRGWRAASRASSRPPRSSPQSGPRARAGCTGARDGRADAEPLLTLVPDPEPAPAVESSVEPPPAPAPPAAPAGSDRASSAGCVAGHADPASTSIQRGESLWSDRPRRVGAGDRADQTCRHVLAGAVRREPRRAAVGRREPRSTRARVVLRHEANGLTGRAAGRARARR